MRRKSPSESDGNHQGNNNHEQHRHNSGGSGGSRQRMGASDTESSTGEAAEPERNRYTTPRSQRKDFELDVDILTALAFDKHGRSAARNIPTKQQNQQQSKQLPRPQTVMQMASDSAFGSPSSSSSSSSGGELADFSSPSSNSSPYSFMKIPNSLTNRPKLSPSSLTSRLRSGTPTSLSNGISPSSIGNIPNYRSNKHAVVLKRYPRDPDSNEHVNVDDVIEKLLQMGQLNDSMGSTKHKRKKDFPFHSWEIQLICHQAREIFLNQPTLLKLQAPIKIVGDIHGQFSDLLRILRLSGVPPDTSYLFLGDYVDRGKQSLETILLLLCYKIKYKDNFFMLRGNHESANITKMYGFYDECKRRSSSKVWKLFIDVFNTLPIAAVIQDKIFCVHGGISPHLKYLDQIDKIARPTDIPEEGLVTDLLWSDPDPSISDWSLNDRGVSYTFSRRRLLEFVKKFNFDLVIRGHMVVEDGYEFFARKKMVTVFSAPNYCGEFQNWGAVMNVTTGLMCSFELLKPHAIKKKRK